VTRVALSYHVGVKPSSPSVADRVTSANVALSVFLAAPLLFVYLRYDSQLALAQCADSVTDAFTALALLYSLRIGAQPADAEHPAGHQRAEPIAALMAAVLAGVLAFEVFRQAVEALTLGSTPRMRWPLAAVFALKVVAKAIMMSLSRYHYRRMGSPALLALEVDARNDVLVGLLALFGFFATRYGSPGWDAWLALPVAFWIGASGIALGRENIRLLMGEAAPPERHDALEALARSVDGVESVHDLTARYDGAHLDVTLHVVVDETLPLRDAHDIAERVEAALQAEPDVLNAMVHVDVDDDAVDA